MIGLLNADMKRAFSSKLFWMSMLVALGILLNGMLKYTNTMKGVSSTYYYIVNAQALSEFSPFAAIFPALGYSIRFAQEYSSGYFQMIQARISWKQYGLVRLITVGLTGGVNIGLPFAVICIIGYVQGYHGLPTDGWFDGMQIGEYIVKYGDIFVLFLKVLLGFLFGIMVAYVSLAFAIWTTNRYITIIAPFVVYELMWFLLMDYPMFNPILLFRGDDVGSYPLSICMEIVYAVLAAVMCWFGLRRRAGYEGDN